jgi:asparagine synthase (glutamine-hydrolysing)
MCGITGIYSFDSSTDVDESVLLRMRDTMVHRGPDGGGHYISPDGRIGLAHRRLSIIDLSAAANQPMPNEDDTVWVTFNGEIYNHVGLRRRLEAAGHTFRTDHSDTEVIIHGYEEWGIDGLLKELEGDYAVGLWDAKKKKLFLFRDRAGVKPLYFSLQNAMLLFGSEIKAIVAHPDVERDVDPMAMYHYLSFLTTPAPMTMFKGVYKLPVAHCLEVSSAGKLRAWQYWDAAPGQGGAEDAPPRANAAAREDFFVQGIRDRLEKAVEKRMMSDVPFGVFLSGGVDSSSNVALMAQLMDRPVDTFTVGFKDFTHLNEMEYADLVAKKFKTNHHTVMIDEADMKGYLEALVHHQDEPIADWVCIPLHFVSKLAKDAAVTVIQVGEGADEQFCGYAGYMAYLRLYEKYWTPFRSITPRPIRQLVAKSAMALSGRFPAIEVYADILDRASRDREHFWTGAVSFWELMKDKLVIPGSIKPSPIPAALRESGLVPMAFQEADSFNVIDSYNASLDAGHPGQDVLTRMIYKEFKLRLPELLLMRVDKITMASSLEARVPFLDHHLIEFSMGIPMSDKIPGNAAKYLLKKAVRGLIPDEIIDRKKMGFGAPMSQWMKGDFGRHVEDSVLSSKLLDRGFFDTAHVRQLFADHYSGRRDNAQYLWTLFNLTAWYDYWIDGTPAQIVEPVAA